MTSRFRMRIYAAAAFLLSVCNVFEYSTHATTVETAASTRKVTTELTVDDDLFTNENCCSGQSLLVPITAGMGLVNQIVTWANGIELGIKLGRNICIMGFGTDIVHDNFHSYHFGNREEWVLNTTLDAHLIFDFREINQRLSSILGDLKVCSASLKIHGDKTTCVGVNKGQTWDGWCDVMKSLTSYNKHKWTAEFLTVDGSVDGTTYSTPAVKGIESVMIGNPWSVYHHQLNGEIFRAFRFKQCFYDVSDEFQLQTFGAAGLHNYTAVHLRVENDANGIPYESTLTQRYFYLKLYVDFIKQSIENLDEHILVATGLNLKHDYLHFAVEYLRTVFPNAYTLPKKDLLHSVMRCGVNQEHSMGRSVEIYAIMDYIASTEARRFVGTIHSSFSHRQGLFLSHPDGSKDFMLMKPINLQAQFDAKFNETDEYKMMQQLAEDTKLNVVKSTRGHRRKGRLLWTTFSGHRQQQQQEK